MATIELRRRKPVALALLFLGVVFVLLGAVALPRAPLVARVFFAALGGLLVLTSAPRVISRSPRFRATAEGVWFGGGALIPWTDVKAVFESGMTVSMHGATANTTAVAFEFHRRGTLFRTPFEHWLSAPFAVGDIDVSPDDSSDRVAVLASKIEALRVKATECAG